MVLAETESPKRVLVFCASSRSCDPIYHEAAGRLGRTLARASMTIVYGGGAVGSMGALADAALEAGGEVVGIQPRFMRDLEWSHAGLTELQLVEDMQERKRRMLECADAVVALPGGSGTLEELFEAITAKRLGFFLNPIILVNQRGFFDPCIATLERCVEERFMDGRHREMWQVVAEPEQVPRAIEVAAPWDASAQDFAAI
jgi:hypothetical protein